MEKPARETPTPPAPRLTRLGMLLALGASVAMFLGRPSGAQPSPGQAEGEMAFSVVEQWGGASQAVAVTADGGRAYLGVGARVWVLDLPPAGDPVVRGFSPVLPGLVRDLALSGPVLYAAGQTGGLWALDVEPVFPTLLGMEPGIPSIVNMVADDADRVYLSRGLQTYTVLDLSDPRSPQPLGCVVFEQPTNVLDIAVVGPIAYLAIAEQGLVAVDMADPLAPVRRGGLPLVEGSPLYVTAVAAHRNLVAAADGPRLRLVDWGDADAPTVLATLNLEGESIHAVHLAGDHAFLATTDFLDNHLRIRSVDLRDPRQPRLVGLVDLAVPQPGLGEPFGYTLALASGGGRLAVAGGSLGLQMLSIGAGGALSEAGGFVAAPWIEAGAMTGDGPMMAAADTGIWKLDFSRSSTPSPLWQMVGAADQTLDLTRLMGGVDGLFASAESGAGVRLLAGSKEQPGLRDIASLSELNATRRVMGSPGSPTFFAADAVAGLRRIRLESAAGSFTLKDVGGLDLGFDTPEGLGLALPLLHVAHGGVSVFDVEAAGGNPPSLLWRADTPGYAYGVDTLSEGDVAPGSWLVAVADGEEGLSLLKGATLIGHLDTPGTAVDVALSPRADRAFVADREGGVHALDLTDRSRPRLIASWSGVPEVVDVELGVVGDGPPSSIWLATRAGGVYHLELGAPLPPATVTPTPRRPVPGHTPAAPKARIWLPVLGDPRPSTLR